MPVFATWDPNCTHEAGALSNGNRDFSPNGAGRMARGTLGTFTAPKCYWEQTLVNTAYNGTYDEWGLGYANCSPFGPIDRYEFRNNYLWHNSNLVSGAYGPLGTNNTIGIAVEDTGSGVKVWFRDVDGTWIDGGDPANGTSPKFTLSSAQEWFPMCRAAYHHPMRINAGQEAYVFTPPAGFTDLAIPDILQFEDLALDLAYIHDHAEPLQAPLHIVEDIWADVPADLRLAALSIEGDLGLDARLCGQWLRSLPLDIRLDGGEDFADLAARLGITDGTALADLPVRALLTRTAPLYRAVIAQRLRSVKHA